MRGGAQNEIVWTIGGGGGGQVFAKFTKLKTRKNLADGCFQFSGQITGSSSQEC